MAEIAVFASGSGTNFQKLGEFFKDRKDHRIKLLICDRKDAAVLVRAQNLGIKAVHVSWWQRPREEAEAQVLKLLQENQIDLCVLAGFMRLLSPQFTRALEGRLVNIHPALLPRHPGAHGITDSWDSQDQELGITIHYVDEGMDTGPIISQHSFTRTPEMTLEEAEKKIHDLEYLHYSPAVLSLCQNLPPKENL